MTKRIEELSAKTLTNGEVKSAVPTYEDTRKHILAFLLVDGAFGPLGPFGFNLSRVGAVTGAIRSVVDAPVSTEPNSLDGFRRELILATTDATRREQVPLVMHLYTALMEKHLSLSAPPATLADGEASKAGEYLLRCLGVQAAYDDLQTYRFVIEQFRLVVAAVHCAIEKHDFRHMFDHLFAAATGASPAEDAWDPQMWDLIAVTGPVPKEQGYERDALLRRARALGKQLAEKKCAVLALDAAPPNEDLPTVASYAQLGAIDAGGKAVCLGRGDSSKWTPARQLLLLNGPLEQVRPIVAGSTIDLASPRAIDNRPATSGDATTRTNDVASQLDTAMAEVLMSFLGRAVPPVRPEEASNS